jgi:hypothetical protein
MINTVLYDSNAKKKEEEARKSKRYSYLEEKEKRESDS